jgi:hypothetical protein
MAVEIKDYDGKPVRAGDTIYFTYGIPPVGVEAKVIERDGELIYLSPGHRPEEGTLDDLEEHVGLWTKVES